MFELDSIPCQSKTKQSRPSHPKHTRAAAHGLADTIEQVYRAILEIRREQKLVTEGPYRYMRHPMYTSIFLWTISVLLISSNWALGGSQILAFEVLYLARVGEEERMMLEQFGEQYRAYMEHTGRLTPKFHNSRAGSRSAKWLRKI